MKSWLDKIPTDLLLAIAIILGIISVSMLITAYWCN